jgi:hypothetical protein
MKCQKYHKVSKPPYDTTTVISVTPLGGTTDSDTCSDSGEVSECLMSLQNGAFVIVLTPIKTGWRATPIQRLKGALKVLGRGFGLRCVRIVPGKAEP